MAGDYKTASAYATDLNKEKDRRAATLGSDMRQFLDCLAETEKHKGRRLFDEFSKACDTGTPSVFFESHENEMVKIIAPGLLPHLYYALDSVNRWQISTSPYRRTYRSPDFGFYGERMKEIIKEFSLLTAMKQDPYDLLTGNYGEPLISYAQYYKSSGIAPSYLIASLLDSGDERTLKIIEEAVFGDGGVVPVEMIKGIFMSRNKEAFALMEKLLLAARLQEGLRQAVCEQMDCGTVEAFLYMYDVIIRNDLLRLSSVKRALMTFTGLSATDVKSTERVVLKQADAIGKCLENSDGIRDRMRSSNDHMQIYLALWSEGFTDIGKAFETAKGLIFEGSREQRLTAAYFISRSDIPFRISSVCLDVFEKLADDEQTVAVMMSCFMRNIESGLMMSTRKYVGNKYETINIRVNADPYLYFTGKEQARQAYHALDRIASSLSGKKKEFTDLVFPGTSDTLSKPDIMARMAFCASASYDRELMRRMAREIPSIAAYSRDKALRLLLTEPEDEEEFELLTKALGDGETYTRKTADTLLEHELTRDASVSDPLAGSSSGMLPAVCYTVLEDLLRLKKADIRKNVLKFINTMDDKDKVALVERLVSDKNAEKRAAGLDIALQMKNSGSPYWEEASAKTGGIKDASGNEKILLQTIEGSPDEDLSGREEGFGIYDPQASYEPSFDKDYTEECFRVFKRIFPKSPITPSGSKPVLSLPKKNGTKEIIEKFDDLMEEKKNVEYEINGFKHLLGNGIFNAVIPVPEVWDRFYEEQIGSSDALMRIAVMLSCGASNARGFPSIGITVRGYEAFCLKHEGDLFGREAVAIDHGKLRHRGNMIRITDHLMKKYGCIGDYAKAACALAYFIAKSKDPMIFRYKRADIDSRFFYGQDKPEYQRTFMSQAAVSVLMQYIVHDPESFAYNYAVAEKFDFDYLRDLVSTRNARTSLSGPSVQEYVAACVRGVITKDFMYKCLLRKERIGRTLNLLSAANVCFKENAGAVVRGVRSATPQKAGNVLASFLFREQEDIDPAALEGEDRKIADLVRECYGKIVTKVIKMEFRRGDTPTEFSENIYELVRVYGLSVLADILSCFGSDKFNRSKYFSYGRSDSKADVLSHLLRIIVPDKDEGDEKAQAAELRKLAGAKGISDKRLIEASLYSPEWIGIVSEYLGWEGFTSCCYYFMAHMKETFDDKRTAMIARYSPLTPNDLNNGAFDSKWFAEVYEAMGKKRFDEVYDAAKYITDGAKHSRARKYADAATGKLDADKTWEEINAKRNKDLLMAYAIIPGTPEQLRERYVNIRTFIKESRNFGAQRRASEKLAGETAIKNMATAAGYPDETRFILRMENSIADDLRHLWEPSAVGECEACLKVEDGKVAIKITKGGKELKSVPSKIKKEELIKELTEAKATFTEQYRRTRIMLEEAMENETKFTSGEISDMRANPVLTDMVDTLVFETCEDKKFGLPADLDIGQDRDAEIKVAHPYSMFKAGQWRKLQETIYDRSVVQPFKQVFRELYVKTDEEREAFRSMRYSGNQIQPGKTAAVLKGRRWVADIYEGLQKIYYKEDIIATIYALADWFSPSDIEAPTLEYVEFIDRKTYSPVKIADVPDIIFSEVMRDVDLAVSVAHAGEVDPEMSHSTVEMRRCIAEFTCRLFKLSNVTFTDSHALIKGTRGSYSVHLGSGVIHLEGGLMINVLPVHSQHRGRIFLPFVDDDPKTAEIMSKILLFAEDKKIKDPFILDQII